MEIRWVEEAIEDLEQTLNYWDNRNCSTTYSEKIIAAIEELKVELMTNPYFLAKYSEYLDIYRRIIMKGRFIIYYKIIEEKNLIEVRYFRSNYQKPLTDS